MQSRTSALLLATTGGCMLLADNAAGDFRATIASDRTAVSYAVSSWRMNRKLAKHFIAAYERTYSNLVVFNTLNSNITVVTSSSTYSFADIP